MEHLGGWFKRRGQEAGRFGEVWDQFVCDFYPIPLTPVQLCATPSPRYEGLVQC